jgi:hypothetical protein
MAEKTVPTGMESPEMLSLWADDLQREIDQISVEMLPLQKRLEATREKLDLVKRLIHLSAPDGQNAITESKSSQGNALPEIEDHIEKILAQAATPLHISQIREQLIASAIPLPGRGDEANIILRIRRASSRFVRTGRGTYALASWNLPTYAAPFRKKRVRRRRKTQS